MRKSITCLFLSVGVLLYVAAGGCGEDSTHKPDATVQNKLATSLHATTRGMEYWYEREQGGFETLTGIPYDELSCKTCHVDPTSCGTCHSTAQAAELSEPVGSSHAAAPSAAVVTSRAIVPSQGDGDCLRCHGFQSAEIFFHLSDYHRDVEGLGCRDCHNSDEIHGDGTAYNSLHEPGAMTTSCSNKDCHDAVASNEFHDNHSGESPIGHKMECAACHVQSVVTCYSCHFESEVQGLGKFALGQFANWKFLLRRDRGDGELKIDTGNMLTATYQGKAFVALGPFYAHTVNKNAVTDCGDCHNNEYVQEYNNTGKIVIATWNETEGMLVANIKGKGIIPIPPDWRETLEFDFATYDDDGQGTPEIIQLEPSEVGKQMLFAEPLEALPE